MHDRWPQLPNAQFDPVAGAPLQSTSTGRGAATYHEAGLERNLQAGRGDLGTTPNMLTGNLMRRAAPQSVSSISGARSSFVSGACRVASRKITSTSEGARCAPETVGRKELRR